MSKRIKMLTIDLFKDQLSWSIVYMSIMLVIYLGLQIIGRMLNNSINVTSIFEFSLTSGLIYLFVIGIIASSVYVPKSVAFGISRKEYGISFTITAILLSFTIPLLFLLLGVIEFGVVKLFNFSVNFPTIQETVSLYYTFAFNNVTWYLLGGIIHLSFYRFHWLIGLGSIFLSFINVTIQTIIWEKGFNNLIGQQEYFDNNKLLLGINPILSIMFTIIIIGLLHYMIQQLLKNITIKL